MRTRSLDPEMAWEILDAIDEAIHVVDPEGYTIFYNKASAKLDGLEIDQVMGKHVLQTYPSLTRDTSTLLRVCKTRRPIEDYEQTYITQEGRAITTISSTIPLFCRGEFRGALEVARDITRVKQLSETVSELRARLYRPRRDKTRLSDGSAAIYRFEDIIGRSRSIIALKERARKAANNSSPVLIWGETGTGKELFVQAIHNAGLRDGPFIAQNCAALPESLLEGIFFGSTRGSFTGAADKPGLFELADGGTLFLDELNSMPLDLQAKLLRVLDTGQVRRLGDIKLRQVNVRVVAAMNVSPEEALSQGLLRRDLFYRLNVISLYIPPLRERKEDIPVLAKHFAAELSEELGYSIEIDPEVLEAFSRYSWPGNVRELKHVIEAAVRMNEDHRIRLEHLPENILSPLALRPPGGESAYEPEALFRMICRDGVSVAEVVKELERELIEMALRHTGGNVSRASELLSLPRSTLQYKIRTYRLG